MTMNTTTTEDGNHSMQYVPTRRERLGWRLFPSDCCDMPDTPDMRDCLVTRTEVELSFADRLRILVSGRAAFEVKTATQNIIGAHATKATFCVRPPGWLAR